MMDTVEALARELLDVDDKGNCLMKKYLDLVDNGLPKSSAGSLEVIVVGAGMAGLVAGSLLKAAGHNVTIVEANGQRIGGRIKTFRTDPLRPEEKRAFSDPKLYAEAGAMRIPDEHPLVNRYIDKFKLEKRPFYNVDVDPAGTKVFNGWLRVNGLPVRRKDYNGRSLSSQERHLGFPLLPDEERTAKELLDAALEPLRKKVDLSLPLAERIEGWKEIIDRYDEYSMRRFLREAGCSEDTVDLIGTLENLTSRITLSFIQNFIELAVIRPDAKYWELRGGNWRLPYAFYSQLSEDLVMNARVTHLEWTDIERGRAGLHARHNGLPGVWVRTEKEPGDPTWGDYQGRSEKELRESGLVRCFTGDVAIVTIPFSSLRFLTVEPEFSYKKRRAIMELHYDSATKVLLEFRERFWEWDDDRWQREFGDDQPATCGIVGGASIVDNPNRFIYYPSHRVNRSEGGVILASYTWADEANRWDSLPPNKAYEFALQGLVELHGECIRSLYVGGQMQSWMRNFYSFGEAAIFSPGQLRELHPFIPLPEGNVHFAGEHTSLKHAWIEGAIQSGIRAALEVHQRL